MLPREFAIAVPLTVMAIVLGVYPQALFDYMQPSVDQQVQQLADWTEQFDASREALKKSIGEEEEQVALAAPLSLPTTPAALKTSIESSARPAQ
jgi:NADH-quinone oxidoreductase subunit M